MPGSRARSEATAVVAMDGRAARSVRTRQAIVDTMLALVLEGEPRAPLKLIAKRAGVTQRTLFNHFPDIADAQAAAMARARELCQELMPGVPTCGDRATRVQTFFDSAADLYETYSATRWAALTATRAIPGFDARQGKGHVMVRLEKRVLELLEPLDPGLRRDAPRLAALRVAVDPMAWRLLRSQQGLSTRAASQAMAAAVLALVGAG